MALLTKAQVRTAIQQAIDDPKATRWAASSLDVLTSIVQDTLWQQILDTWPWLLSQTDATTPSAGGVVLTSALSKRLYRIQRVSRASDDRELHAKLYNETIPQPAYYMLGANIITDPIVTGASSLDVTYAYLPTKYTDLSTDATVLEDWPDGHEAALIYATAAWAMTKGDAENMQQIARIADNAMESLVTHIQRMYPIATSARTPTIKFSTVLNPLLGSTPQR